MKTALPISTNSHLTLRGRTFTAEAIETIRICVEEYFDYGRTAISRAICERLDWRQPNGWLKDRACRDVLLTLEQRGLIALPPPLVTRNENSRRSIARTSTKLETIDLRPVVEFPTSITLEFAKSNKAESLWNRLVETYHYLGHKVIVGRCIKYLIKSDERVLGAIAFSSAAWHVANRDTILLNSGIAEHQIRDLVINNSRFLILPNVNVPNLASHVLALSTKKIAVDWQAYYSLKPLVVETFVQPSLFAGSCYKAANWLEIGITKGYAKSGSSFHNGQEPKLVFLYGLNRSVRRRLRRSIDPN